MRAFSRCLSRKAFSVRTAIARIPRAGSGAPTAVMTRPAPDASRRFGASCRRKSRSSSSGPEFRGKRKNVRPLRRSAVRGRNARDGAGAVATASVLMSVAVRGLRRRPRYARSPIRRQRLSSSRVAGAAAGADGDVKAPRPRPLQPRQHRRRPERLRNETVVAAAGKGAFEDAGAEAVTETGAIPLTSRRPRREAPHKCFPSPFAPGGPYRVAAHRAASSSETGRSTPRSLRSGCSSRRRSPA